VTGVTYNGVTLTQAKNLIVNGRETALWYLANPPTGTHNVVISTSGLTRIRGGALSLTGVDASPLGATASNSGTSTTPNVVISTLSDCSWLIDNAIISGENTLTVGGGQAERWNIGMTGIKIGGSTRVAPTVDAYAILWKDSVSELWGSVAIEIKPLP
jgi:hypothetical protein